MTPPLHTSQARMNPPTHSLRSLLKTTLQVGHGLATLEWLGCGPVCTVGLLVAWAVPWFAKSNKGGATKTSRVKHHDFALPHIAEWYTCSSIFVYMQQYNGICAAIYIRLCLSYRNRRATYVQQCVHSYADLSFQLWQTEHRYHVEHLMVALDMF